MIGAVAAGFASPSCRYGTTIERLVLVEDVSDSLGGRRWEALDDGATLRIEVADGVRAAPDDGGPAPVLSRERSRLADGLRAAAAALGGEPGVVRLRTDGRDTEGDVVRVAGELSAAGHRVFVEPPFPAPADVALDAVRVVAAGADSPVEVAVSVSASVEGRVRVSLFRDGAERDARTVDVRPALPTLVRLADGASRRTSDAFEVILVPEEGTPDEDRANDRVRFELAADVARVVIVGEGPAAAVLDDGVRTTRVSTLDDVDAGAADLLVASNLPARALGDGGAEHLARFVARGGVLLVLGGEDAYGPGGVAGTAYEALLALRPERDGGEGVACVVAFDHSGSTGESLGGVPPAIDDLRRAVRALDRRVPSKTTLLVLPFSDRPELPIELARPRTPHGADETDRGLRAIDALAPAGGTNLALAVEAAIATASRVPDVRRRRVFLLTDGDPDHPPSPSAFAAQRARLDRAGVEFAAIVRGDEAAAVALRALAARPGDVIRVEAASEFPEALVRTFDRGRSPDEIRDGPFTPVPADDGPDARAAASPRPSRLHRLDVAGDAVVLSRARGADGSMLPLAAVRSLGAGRVACFAGGPGLESAAARSELLAALHPWMARLGRSAVRGLAAERDGDRLRVEAVEGLGSIPLFVGDEAPAQPLIETANGVYEGRLPPGTSSDALLRAGSPPRALRLPFAPALEHRGAGLDLAALRAIAESGFGRVLGTDEATPRRRHASRIELSPYCFGMAVLLLLLDRALDRSSRRVSSPAAERP